MFLKRFYENRRLKYFNDSLNIELILAPGGEVFYAKFTQFLFTFKECSWTKHIFASALLPFTFWDKPYQEINLKSHLNSVLLFNQGKTLSDLYMSRLN